MKKKSKSLDTLRKFATDPGGGTPMLDAESQAFVAALRLVPVPKLDDLSHAMRCPFCQSDKLSLSGLYKGQVQVHCECGASGPTAESVSEAVEAWNLARRMVDAAAGVILKHLLEANKGQ